MKFTKEAVLYGIIGLLTGVVLTLIVATYSVNHHSDSMMQMMGMHTHQSSDSDMNMDTMPGMTHGGN